MFDLLPYFDLIKHSFTKKLKNNKTLRKNIQYNNKIYYKR